MSKKIVVFGAGKIGRSFIGQIFSRAGYHVVFIDIDHGMIDSLNSHGKYKVVIKSRSGTEIIPITQVSGIYLEYLDLVSEELRDASLAAISVGQQGLEATLPAIREGLILRLQKHGKWPLDIIIAENMRNADVFVMSRLKELLPEDYPANEMIGLVETSIGKMVPIMSKKDLEEDPLQVFAEPYNSLIVSKNGFLNPVPEIADLEPKVNIKAWVDRKLFIHNLGHVTAAYLGYKKNPSWIYIYEALEDPEIYSATSQTMLQSAEILLAEYPGEFSLIELTEHIDDLLDRFKNKALGDTIYRVGSDLYRKLGPEDRLISPMRAALKHKKKYNLIYNVIVAAMSFRAASENGTFYPDDQAFFKDTEKGINYILKNVCEIEEIIHQF